MTGREREAVRKCAEWLKACLDLGWSKSDLDFLEELWWKYHDSNGEMTKPVRDVVRQDG